MAIVGAGICGLFLARKLSQNGHQVTVFEKKEKIGKKECSGLFSERILKFIPESRKLIQNKINSVLINFPGKRIRIRFSKDFLVMSHFELDNLMAGLAKRAGAKITLNHSISSLPQGFDKIIGCDGPNSVVRKELGLPNLAHRLAVQGFVSKEDYSDSVEAWPVKDGFLWKIPRGKETEYGIIADPEEAKEIFDKFLSKNQIKSEKLESALVSRGFSITASSSVTLCGEATGLTKPWSGGGVIWGLTAAEILLKNFPDFLKYKNALRRFFLPKIILSKAATEFFYFLGLKVPWILPGNLKIEADFLF